MRKQAFFYPLSILLIFTSCTTPRVFQLGENIQLVSFDDEASTGKSVGLITGKDCTYYLLSPFIISGASAVDTAFENARSQSPELSFLSNDKNNKPVLRYINNVRIFNEGFLIPVLNFGRTCIVVKGVGRI